MIFVKENLNFSVVNVCDDFNIEKCFESMYHAPSGNFDTFLDCLEGVLDQICLSKATIIAGDFNVDFKSTNSKLQGVNDILSCFNLVQTIYEPTRGKNVIDNIFVDSGISLLSSRVEDTGLSDHGSQYVHLMLENRQSATVENKIMYRPVTQQGMNLFFNRVSAVEWNFINDNSMSVDGRFNKFINILEEAYLESFPEKQYKVGSDKGEKVGWFDEHLKNMRDHLKFLEELRKQYNQPDLVQVCSMFRKQYKLAIAKAKMKANDNKIKKSKNPSRCMWNIINHQRGLAKSSPQHQIQPNTFNTYFSQVAVSLVKNLPDPNPEFINSAKFNTPDAQFSFSEVTFNQVRDIINQLKNKNSRDVFGMSVSLIKSIKNLIITPLTKLINLSISHNIFPAILKKALVTPVFKQGDPELPENYRPISLLPIVSKIIERCMASQIVHFLEVNNCFSNSQFGFRGNKSTTLGVLDLVSFILESFHKLEYDALLFCDLTKAFDCVDHDILLSKLKKYNFKNDSIQLVKSYLQNRLQAVKVARAVSDERVINIGVPQGSILGPVLFLLYINDLPNIVEHENTLSLLMTQQFPPRLIAWKRLWRHPWLHR
nr:unnamed protein product [Callosobruchus analis]